MYDVLEYLFTPLLERFCTNSSSQESLIYSGVSITDSRISHVIIGGDDGSVLRSKYHSSAGNTSGVLRYTPFLQLGPSRLVTKRFNDIIIVAMYDNGYCKKPETLIFEIQATPA